MTRTILVYLMGSLILSIVVTAVSVLVLVGVIEWVVYPSDVLLLFVGSFGGSLFLSVFFEIVGLVFAPE
jgi:hypothetical protein